jgi:hypothetical protein
MNIHLKESMLFLLFGLVSLTQNAFSTNNYTWNQSSGSITYLEENYCNDIDEAYTINTGSSSPVKIDYNVQCEYGCDYLLIYAFDSSDNLILLKNVAGWETGSVTSFYPGKIKLVFYTDGSVSYADDGGCGDGFSVSFASQSGYTTASTYLLGGNTILPFGKVGIGTITPSSKLDVNAASLGVGARVFNGSHYINVGGLGSGTSYVKGYENTVAFGNAYTNGSTTLLTGDVERLRINASGNVGIGTTTPGGKLDVSVANSNIALRLTASGISAVGQTVGDISFFDKDNVNEDARIAAVVENSYGSGLGFSTKVGNSSPGLASEKMRILGNGNVGIGTPTPGAKLDIVGATNNMPLRITNDTYNDWVLQKRRSDNTQLFGIKETGSNGSMSIVTNNLDRLIVTNEGTVGIGTNMPNSTYALDVNGIICANEVKVTLDHFADFVFDSEYNLPKLNDVHSYIKANGHLPNIPSAREVKTNGIGLAEMQVKLLQKVEELTLYVIEQQKRIEELECTLSKKSY